MRNGLCSIIPAPLLTSSSISVFYLQAHPQTQIEDRYAGSGDGHQILFEERGGVGRRFILPHRDALVTRQHGR